MEPLPTGSKPTIQLHDPWIEQCDVFQTARISVLIYELDTATRRHCPSREAALVDVGTFQLDVRWQGSPGRTCNGLTITYARIVPTSWLCIAYAYLMSDSLHDTLNKPHNLGAIVPSEI